MAAENESNSPDTPSESSNPFLSPAERRVPDEIAADNIAPTGPSTLVPDPPRLWTTFAAFFGAFGLMIVFSVIAIGLYLAPTIVRLKGPPDPNTLTKTLSTPVGFLVQAFPSQLAIALTVIVAATCSPVAFNQRLGFRNSGLTTVECLATGVGAFVPAVIGMCLAYLVSLVIPPDESVATLYESMTLGWAIPFVLFIALAPGFAEEMMMRGYMQRRFLQRWSPSLSIFVSAAMFALMHILPHTVVFAFPIGLWLGYVAWKTDSIWPTILGHALINGVWNILNISHQLVGYSDNTYYIVSGVLCAIGVVGFLYSWPAIHQAAGRKQQLEQVA